MLQDRYLQSKGAKDALRFHNNGELPYTSYAEKGKFFSVRLTYN